MVEVLKALINLEDGMSKVLIKESKEEAMIHLPSGEKATDRILPRKVLKCLTNFLVEISINRRVKSVEIRQSKDVGRCRIIEVIELGKVIV